MTFDKQEHQVFVLQLLANSQFPGAAIEAVYEFKRAVVDASICPEPEEYPDDPPLED